MPRAQAHRSALPARRVQPVTPVSITVEESFDISGRGAGVVYAGAELPAGVVLRARVGGREVRATIELLLRRTPAPHERHALMLEGLTGADVPKGTVIELFGAGG